MTPDRSPLTFRNPALLLSVFDYVLELDPDPVSWLELLDVFTAQGYNPKTVENALYDLTAFGALHRIGNPPGRRGARDSRALKPTPLGTAWRDGTTLGLPGEPDDPFESAERIAQLLEGQLDDPEPH